MFKNQAIEQLQNYILGYKKWSPAWKGLAIPLISLHLLGKGKHCSGIKCHLLSEPLRSPGKQKHGAVFLLGSHPALRVVAILVFYTMFCRFVLPLSFFRTSLDYDVSILNAWYNTSNIYVLVFLSQHISAFCLLWALRANLLDLFLYS